MKRALIRAASAVLLILPGALSGARSAAGATRTAAASRTASAARLQPVDAASLRQRLAALRGKVVVLNV